MESVADRHDQFSLSALLADGALDIEVFGERDAVIVLDCELRVRDLNEVARRWYGVDVEDFDGVAFLDPARAGGDPRTVRLVETALTGVAPEPYLSTRNPALGDAYAVLVHAMPIRAADGRCAGVVVVATDVSGVLRVDPFTDIPYYRPEDFAGLTLTHDRGAVLVAYVDRNEAVVSPQLGPVASGELLGRVGRHLRALLAGADAEIRRMHSSHFVVVLPSVALADLDDVARAVTRIGWKDDPEVGPVLSSLSVGIARAARGGTATVPELTRNATLALEEAYRRQPGTAMMFAPDMESGYESQLTLGVDLRKAIDEDRITLVYQPQVRLSDGALVGVEALARWHHPTLGDISPERFVDLAERMGLVRWLDHAVCDRALAQLRAWDDAGVAVPRISVNVSPATLTAPTMRISTKQMVLRHGIDPRRVTLEIIESQMVEETIGAQALIELSGFGFRISLDDFGSGYSSFGQLAALPIDELKVDRAFMADPRKGYPVLTAAKYIAVNFGQELVAEGVETREQAEMLEKIGCQFAQGYHFAKPLTAEEFEAWLRAR